MQLLTYIIYRSKASLFRFFHYKERGGQKYDRRNYGSSEQLANSLDEENYRQYGGREIRMNENGFYSDRVEQPCIFYDEKEEPKAKVYVKKYDIKCEPAAG